MSESAIPRLQSALHRALGVYVNGCRVARGDRREIRRLCASLGDPVSRRDIAVSELLSAGYRRLERVVEVAATRLVWQDCPEPAYYDEWRRQIGGTDRRFLAPVRAFANDVAENASLFAFAGFHGSLSTLDYLPGFSDFDAIVVLGERTAMGPAPLRRARRVVARMNRHLFQLCLLQHHGFQVMTTLDWSFYPCSFFPPVLMRYTTGVVGRMSRFRSRPDRDERVGTMKAFRSLFAEGRFARAEQLGSLSELVQYNQAILLLPCLWLGLIEGDVYKRESFARFYELVDPALSRIVRSAETVRRSIRVNPIPYRPLFGALSLSGRGDPHIRVSRAITRLHGRRQRQDACQKLGSESSRDVLRLLDHLLDRIGP